MNLDWKQCCRAKKNAVFRYKTYWKLCGETRYCPFCSRRVCPAERSVRQIVANDCSEPKAVTGLSDAATVAGVDSMKIAFELEIAPVTPVTVAQSISHIAKIRGAVIEQP